MEKQLVSSRRGIQKSAGVRQTLTGHKGNTDWMNEITYGVVQGSIDRCQLVPVLGAAT